MRKKITITFGLLILQFSISNAVELMPVGDFRFLGGQYFYNSNPSSLSGNLSLTVSPAVKFSDRFSLIPTYMGTYRGTKEVSDLAGGGTLFQDQQSHLVSVKGVYAAKPGLKLKLNAGYRNELLRETKDETWGKGLFDYRKFNTGLEAEYYLLKKYTLRAGIDSYTLRFPNYESLESSVTASGLGRELAGKNTLDSDNLMTTLGFEGAFGRIKSGLRLVSIAKNYPDQTVVTESGDFSASKRKDSFLAADINAGYPYKLKEGLLIMPVVSLQFVTNDSNQGHYDARKTKYIPDYYDYGTTGFGLGADFLLGREKPVALSLSFISARQAYKDRLSQDIDGNYLAEKIYSDESVITLTFAQQIAGGFKLRFITSFVDSKSNMKYEKTYTYNYTTSNYLMGFSYEF